MRIFELAQQAKTVRHYVWSSLDYAVKKAGFDPKYRPSVVSDSDLSWSSLTSEPYMEMLKSSLWGPLTRRADGTHVFAFPTGQGRVPMVSLKDIGFFARCSFYNRAEVSGKDLEITGDVVTLEDTV
ncbi:uncharacterized protein PHACADRAFT_198916 [Phanerochaete carnosa HHB-10118-sp]|uniref:NmrA-like domain-containing protein n=1 Tax=Phanerochaete carnosa (strain HHB-10118-sp) TaxID=650164 RepID=K5VN58_PHACS|nr:uncharacterized protein PHACADRAFT_198916 [Phanerochaete carnosa HHB-10118-sp]EKM52868.1 hypothetical protein PHACADRAFT_198916 [Phanerochaete carnosa HHB-10118-sp]